MKKTAAVVMILLILLCALCPAACAEGGEALQKGDILYFGVYEEEPIRWLVLDPAATNAGTPGIFLLSEHMLANQGVVYSWARAVWQGSEGQAWCSNMLETAFSEAERAAIPAVSREEEALQLYGLSWGAVSLEEEKVFFPSVVELSEYIGPNDGDPGLTASMPNGKIGYYWLRTPHGFHNDYAGLVLEDNQVHDFLVYGSWGVRPATNLGGDGLLYVSPARRTLTTRELGPLPVSEDGEWKATVADPSIDFRVEDCSYQNGAVTVRYSGAPEGAWISLLEKDTQGKTVSYGCLSQSFTADGSVTLSPDVSVDNTLWIFAELDRGELSANTASAPVELKWEIPAAPAETPAPEEPEETGTISIAVETPEPTPPPVRSDENFRLFLRQYWMFAIPFAFLTLAAVIVIILQAVFRRRRF